MTEMYKTRMSSDFFIAKELEKKINKLETSWHNVVMKELIDNALDAIEGENPKNLEIQYEKNCFRVFDNGGGFSVEDVKNNYDFDNYWSKNRHFITASRGKQGNGLKAIIGICHIKQYELLWHTSEGIILRADINADRVEDEGLEISFTERGTTDLKGVEICKVYIPKTTFDNAIWQYSKSNPDVNFNVSYCGEQRRYTSEMPPINRRALTSLSFYTYKDFCRLINVQEKSQFYKIFLKEHFGKRVGDESSITGKIENLDFDSWELKKDFEKLKQVQNTKHYTLLKKHLIGLAKNFNTTIYLNNKGNIMAFPCIVEYEVNKLADNYDNCIDINCYVNNSRTYNDGRSIIFRKGMDKINHTKKDYPIYSISEFVEKCSGYQFNLHFIAPYLKFYGHGKVEIDISDFVDELAERLKSAYTKSKNKHNASMPKEKKFSQYYYAEPHMTDAFMLASSNGKYSITARQMYYKLRELVGRENPDWETESTYKQFFTKKWLTAWLKENKQFEDKVNFAERGNFYVDGSQLGLGSANVRSFVNSFGAQTDTFKIYGELQSELYIDDSDFNIQHKYDKVLYIEKTGFDDVFRSEGLDRKYNMIIVSGQGYGTRAGRRLLYELQQQGLKVYCMHDLDIFGVGIYNSLLEGDELFEYDIDAENLGVTPADVERYGIVPEVVDAISDEQLEKLDEEHRKFFQNKENRKSRRVELNAFSTEQLLEIIDNKLRGTSNLPKINISQSLDIDNRALREVALMRIVKKKYSHFLEGFSLDVDLAEYDGALTLPEAKELIPDLMESLLQRYESELSKIISA